ncbi:hypothetical protein FOPG_19192 [Fusarium oxysporum f. sp. conglutinans race 2 54008]|uniref:Uncharacterized protein n=1 Tax=Fusarium oxysporum f. sp. conglutinans race 2 54008 TaxID=1089457 RepID=X0GLQ1_FUSOX|nr:hypothetical protein FOPG_19192 [Fusarium oxysporum f. sp. conglutinans race 2 54008]
MDASVVYGLDLPDAPKAPDVPKSNTGPRNRPSDESETSYTDAFKTYLHQWVEWDNKVIDHFEARCCIYAIRASEAQWHLSGDGGREYFTWWLQDFDVLRTWYNAHKVHGQRVAEYKEHLARMSPGESKGRK